VPKIAFLKVQYHFELSAERSFRRNEEFDKRLTSLCENKRTAMAKNCDEKGLCENNDNCLMNFSNVSPKALFSKTRATTLAHLHAKQECALVVSSGCGICGSVAQSVRASVAHVVRLRSSPTNFFFFSSYSFFQWLVKKKLCAYKQ